MKLLQYFGPVETSKLEYLQDYHGCIGAQHSQRLRLLDIKVVEKELTDQLKKGGGFLIFSSYLKAIVKLNKRLSYSLVLQLAYGITDRLLGC